MTSQLAIGIDLGATKIAGVLAAPDGRALAVRQAPTAPQRGTPAVMDDIARLVDELARESRGYPLPLSGIGIGSPGVCDPVRGIVYNAVNLGWDEVPLVSELQTRLGNRWPVFLQKDANASTLGEYYLGAARGCRDFIMFTVGSGLGGGVMAAGRLVTGANWNAAEVGHLAIDPENGRPCACGLRGCAETVASGPGMLAEAYAVRQEQYWDSPLAVGELSTPAILSAARQSDPLALEVTGRVGGWLGLVAAAGAAFLNPERLIIGGGLGIAGFDLFLPGVRRAIEKHTLPATYSALQLMPSRLESSALGAASMVWYGLGVESIGEEVRP